MRRASVSFGIDRITGLGLWPGAVPAIWGDATCLEARANECRAPSPETSARRAALRRAAADRAARRAREYGRDCRLAERCERARGRRHTGRTSERHAQHGGEELRD